MRPERPRWFVEQGGGQDQGWALQRLVQRRAGPAGGSWALLPVSILCDLEQVPGLSWASVSPDLYSSNIEFSNVGDGESSWRSVLSDVLQMGI